MNAKLITLATLATRIEGSNAKRLCEQITKRNKAEGRLPLCGRLIPVFKIGVAWYVKVVDVAFLESPTEATEPVTVTAKPKRKGKRGRLPQVAESFIDTSKSGKG